MKFLLIVLFSVSVFAQNEFSSFISYVNTLQDPQLKNAAVDSFITYARTKGIPFIEGNTANFMFRGNNNVLKIAGDFTSWSDNITMLKLPGTNFFYYSKTFESDARLDYKFVTDGIWILDPENPKKVYGGFGPNSELAMPEYIQPWEIVVNPSISHGTIIYKIISSSNTGSSYNLTIYLPPGYDTLSTDRYPAAYFQDGTEYVNLGSSATVMDNLINAGKIQPVIGVFVKPNNREQEYAGIKRNEYRLFFVNELVPYVDSLYKTIKDPAKRIVTGDSWGGNISALISYNHPEVFGNCGLHSAAFFSNDYEAYNLIINGPVKNIKFAVVWGTYESLFPNMRNFRDSVLSKGYQLTWMERPEGHSWGLWRASTDFLLEYFIPGPTVHAEEVHTLFSDSFKLYQNYPNPFNPSTDITFNLKNNTHLVLKVYNSLGSEIKTIINGELNSGNHIVTFNGSGLPSGVYYYRLYTDNYSETRKMILIK